MTPLHFLFIFVFNFSVPGVFLRNRSREYVPAASITEKFEQILLERLEII